MSMRQRTPTALVLLALVFVITQYAPLVFFFIILQVFILAALVEFYGLARRRKIFTQNVLGVFFALFISLSFYFDRLSLGLCLFLCLLAASVYFVIYISTLEKLAGFPAVIALTFFGAFYLGFSVNHLYLIRVERGPYYLYFLFAVIFLGDTGAYLIGKLTGRHKMTPIASPNKTWEGSFGGILFACAGALAARELLLKDVFLWKAVLGGALVHAAAQVSDPLESLFKRAAGVKDSSNILPGHGGFLDRIDSFVLAAPFFYYLMRYFWD